MIHLTDILRKEWALGLLLCPLPLLAATEQRWRGDVNGDGKLTIADLSAMVAQLRKSTSLADALKANPALDVDKDGKFTLSDTKALEKIILGKAKAELLPTKNGFNDSDMGNPGTDGNEGGFTDGDQENPGTEGGSGGFNDSDMGNPE